MGSFGSIVKGLRGRGELRRRVKQLERRVARLEGGTGGAPAPEHASAIAIASGRTLEILPGNDYARYALPIEYLPSRELRPRWGASRPAIPQLHDLFARHADGYRPILESMRASAAEVADVPLVFLEEALPMPAWSGVPLAPFDALAIYAMIRHHRPRRFFEIGSGATTCWARLAADRARTGTRIVSIDPEPRARIDAICDEVIRRGLETCDPALFDALEPGDILFFDGSHRVFMNSDVTVFMIDVLPRISPGVLIHLHDITLPWDYPDMFVPWYWSEQYILAVYLMAAADRVRPVLPTAFVCRDPSFDAFFTPPPLDLGAQNDGWRGGGSMWFTKTS